MNVIHKNEGAKVQYTVRGSKITFDDEVTYNLAKYERDEDSHIDLCRDKFGNLVSGVIPGMAERYVAQIEIPGRSYDYVLDGEDEDGNPKQKQVAVPLDMDNVTLTLWSMED